MTRTSGAAARASHVSPTPGLAVRELQAVRGLAPPG